MDRAPILTGAKRWVILAVVTLAVLTAGSCSNGPAVRVLFIGNSYTASNNLPAMVADLADAPGRSIEHEVRAPGGWWWRDHAASTETIELIAGGDWDFVVLQEQSMVTSLSSMAERESRPAAVTLALRAVQNGAQPVLFMTWGHRGGNSEVGHDSYESMQAAIGETYREIGGAVAGRVAPVGYAWWLTRIQTPDIDLYQADGSHPSLAGTYLAAAVIAGTILEVDPIEMDRSLGLDDGVAEALRGFASRALAGEKP
ncbi:MAG: SGNH/GDSL hydrolase family protein [Acidimicrobiia bacterium]